MKRRLLGLTVLILIIVFSVSGCVHPSVILSKFNDKRLVSNDPKLYIDRATNSPQWGDLGELTLENGEIVKIVFRGMNGRFSIWEFDEEERYGSGDPPLFNGTYRIEGDTLILEDESGIEIRLEMQELPPTQATTPETTQTGPQALSS